MRKLACSMIVMLIGLGLPASAENRIEEWSGYYQEGVHYRIFQITKTVELLEGSNPDVPWRFVAYDTVTGDPGDIDRIYIQRTSELGAVRLRIEGDAPTHVRGARHLGAINLVDGSDASDTLEFLDLLGNVNGHAQETYGLYAHSAGPLIIDGTVQKPIEIVNDITDAVTIGTLAADVGCDSLQDLTVSGGTSGEPDYTSWRGALGRRGHTPGLFTQAVGHCW